MQEIRFHGRGGQGTVVASILLAKAEPIWHLRGSEKSDILDIKSLSADRKQCTNRFWRGSGHSGEKCGRCHRIRKTGGHGTGYVF